MKRAAALLAALTVTAAVAVAYAATNETNAELYDLLESSSIHARYVKANPQEAARVETYWRTGGAKPTVATAYGRFLVEVNEDRTGTPPPPPPPPDNQVPASITSNCSADVTSVLQAWVNGRPNGSTLLFPSGTCYRIDGGLNFAGRTSLTVVGTGSTLRSASVGDGHRASLRFTNGSGHTVRGFRIEGGYTTPGTHDPAVQWSHGIEVLGTQTILVEDVVIVSVGGDCVYLGLGTQRTRDATVRRMTCTGTGRNGVSFVAADRSRVEQSSTGTVGYVAFDVEPNTGAGFGVDTATVTGNTIGSYVINALTIVGDAPVTGVAFTSNQITAPTGGRIQVTGLPRRTNVTISGNTATATLAYPQAIRLDNVDGAVVSNNTLPTTGVLLRCASVTALTFSGNTPNTSADCVTPPPPPAAGTANVWVDANGGSCARTATPGAYSDAAACPSFVAAYTAAQSGDTVGVTGSLGTQKFAGGFQSTQGPGTKTLTFRGATGNRVRQIHFGSPNLTFDGISVDGGMVAQTGAGLENGGAPFIFRNGSIGNVLDEKGALVTEGCVTASCTQGVTFDNVRFHDVVLRGAGVHLECIMSLWADNLVIRNSRFENCGIMDLSYGIADWWGSFPPSPIDSLTLENNWFGNSRFDNGGCCATYSVALWSTKIAVGNDFGPLNNARIRNNYIEPGSDVIVRPTLGTGNVICGNTGNAPAEWKVAC